MPDTWIEPELYLFHKGVAIYHCYRNNYYEGGVMGNWYTTDITEQGPAFDIRNLSVYQPNADHKTILEAAIDKGELKAPEDAYKPLVKEVNLLITFPELNERPEILHCMTAPDVNAAELCTAFEKLLEKSKQDENADRLTSIDRAILEIEQKFLCKARRISLFREVEIK